MQTPKKYSKQTQPLERSIQSLPIGWLVIIAIFYIIIGRLFFSQLDHSSYFTIFGLRYSFALIGPTIFAILGLGARTIILTLVKIIVAAKAITRAIVLVSIYLLIFSILSNNLLLPYVLLLPCYSGFALLALLWFLAVTASKLLVKFNSTSTFFILLGVSLLGLGLGGLIVMIHHPAPSGFPWERDLFQRL